MSIDLIYVLVLGVLGVGIVADRIMAARHNRLYPELTTAEKRIMVKPKP